MAVSGLPEECTTHAKSVARLALDLMDVSKELRNPNNHLIEVQIISLTIKRFQLSKYNSLVYCYKLQHIFVLFLVLNLLCIV